VSTFCLIQFIALHSKEIQLLGTSSQIHDVNFDDVLSQVLTHVVNCILSNHLQRKLTRKKYDALVAMYHINNYNIWWTV